MIKIFIFYYNSQPKEKDELQKTERNRKTVNKRRESAGFYYYYYVIMIYAYYNRNIKTHIKQCI